MAQELPTVGEGCKRIARDRADWLLDAIACATQDRQFLRGDGEYNSDLGEVILLNAEKAIQVAIGRARPDGESLGEALFLLSDRLRHDGFLSRGDHGEVYERVVAEFEKSFP